MSQIPILLQESPELSALHFELRQSLETGADLRVDARHVRRFPASCLQLLLAVHAELQAAGRRLVVLNPSFAFGLAFEALGFEGEREIFTVEYI